MGLVGTIVGGLQQSSALRRQGKYELASAKRNQELLRQQNLQDNAETKEELLRARENSESVMSSIKARMATNGLVNTGNTSTADLMEEATRREEMNLLQRAQANSIRRRGRNEQGKAILYEGQMRKYNLRQQARANTFNTFVKAGTQAVQIGGNLATGGATGATSGGAKIILKSLLGQ